MDIPTIKAKIMFLNEKDGGLKQMPMLKRERYLPHLVVQDQNAREALIADEYLGVQIINGPEVISPDNEYEFDLALINYPVVKYERLQEETTFTIRDGPRIVGFGRVIAASPREPLPKIAPWNEKRDSIMGLKIIKLLIRVSIAIFLVEEWFIFSHGKTGSELFLAFIVLVCVIYFLFK